MAPERRCDPFLAPAHIVQRHFADELPQFNRNPRATRTRFVLPKQSKTLLMPPNQCLRLHNHKCRSPIETLGKHGKRQTCGQIGPSRFRITFLVQGQLPTKKQIFRRDGAAWSQEQPYVGQHIQQEPVDCCGALHNGRGLCHEPNETMEILFAKGGGYSISRPPGIESRFGHAGNDHEGEMLAKYLK